MPFLLTTSKDDLLGYHYFILLMQIPLKINASKSSNCTGAAERENPEFFLRLSQPSSLPFLSESSQKSQFLSHGCGPKPHRQGGRSHYR